MEIHIQQCQECGSEKLKNIILRESGEPDRIIVQCHDCEHFVASYVLAPMGYYHHGKGFESFLKSLHRSGEFMSGRKVQQLFESRKTSEIKLYEKVMARIKQREEKQKSEGEQ